MLLRKMQQENWTERTRRWGCYFIWSGRDGLYEKLTFVPRPEGRQAAGLSEESMFREGNQ